jgi:hypothetical protein
MLDPRETVTTGFESVILGGKGENDSNKEKEKKLKRSKIKVMT